MATEIKREHKDHKEIKKPPAGYETTFVTRTDLSDEQLKAIHTRLHEIVANFQGQVVLTEDWGKRKLAYPIRKESRGHYTYFVYTGRGNIVTELERNLRLQDSMLRFLTVNLANNFDPAVYQKERAQVHASAKRREEEREARREERNAERRSYSDERSHHESSHGGGHDGAMDDSDERVAFDQE